ncbi:MAG: RNA methyltransferase [Trueperaceae bacterium]
MSLRIILVATKHSGNVGSVARAMKNFGLVDLVLVAPRCRLDRQAYALASHAADVLDRARIVGSAGEALAGRTRVLGTTARLRASPSFEVLAPRPAVAGLPVEGGAVMFGPEDTGLSNTELDLCQAAVRIPTADYASLNLAQAVNVIAYEWFVRSGPQLLPSSADGAQAVEAATREEIEPMISQLVDTLLHIGYTDALKAPSVEHMFRRMLDRAALSKREVAALRGLWSQARWAADQPPDAIPGRRRTR